VRIGSSISLPSAANSVKMPISMETAKEQVQKILEVLPESATLEYIQYHIYVRQKVAQGLADVEAGRVMTHEEAMRRLAVC
jgi:predicted transcriptional regulator